MLVKIESQEIKQTGGATVFGLLQCMLSRCQTRRALYQHGQHWPDLFGVAELPGTTDLHSL